MCGESELSKQTPEKEKQQRDWRRCCLSIQNKSHTGSAAAAAASAAVAVAASAVAIAAIGAAAAAAVGAAVAASNKPYIV